MEKTWNLLTPDAGAVSRIAEALGCHPVVAAVLANRGMRTPEQTSDFVDPTLARLRPPNALKDLDKAVQRIARAIAADENILIFGDYDADGTTATAVLLEFLTLCGARVSYHIPHRLKEGYGLKEQHITQVALPRKARLIITVDCGTSSHAAVAAANAAGIDVVVTDHHTVDGALPPALAVINPKRPDCPAGLQTLAGVGVAFCLVIGLRKHLRDAGFWNETRPEPNLRPLCDLVALGTITDMVPLRGDNRILARAGLELIGSGRRPGLSALLEVSGVTHRAADAEDVAFRLGPRLNAAGRIADAALSVELLTADRPEAARKLADTLNDLNLQRQEIERRIMADVDGILGDRPELLDRRTIVLAEQGWHPGVIGIVASKLMDRHHRPVVLFAMQGGSGRGSARGMAGIDLYAALSACSMYLEELGGHSQAAGLKISAENLPAFREAFEQAVQGSCPEAAFVAKLDIDAVLDLDDISEDLLDQLQALAPWGAGNPEPIFMASDVSVASSARVGGNHRRMQLKAAAGGSARSRSAIQFNVDPRAAELLHFAQAAFRLRWNHWNAGRTLQMVIEAVSTHERPCAPGAAQGG
jgi:single-stranded-DNA-specific exonuclease